MINPVVNNANQAPKSLYETVTSNWANRKFSIIGSGSVLALSTYIAIQGNVLFNPAVWTVVAATLAAVSLAYFSFSLFGSNEAPQRNLADQIDPPVVEAFEAEAPVTAQPSPKNGKIIAENTGAEAKIEPAVPTPEEAADPIIEQIPGQELPPEFTPELTPELTPNLPENETFAALNLLEAATNAIEVGSELAVANNQLKANTEKLPEQLDKLKELEQKLETLKKGPEEEKKYEEIPQNFLGHVVPNPRIPLKQQEINVEKFKEFFKSYDLRKVQDSFSNNFGKYNIQTSILVTMVALAILSAYGYFNEDTNTTINP